MVLTGVTDTVKKKISKFCPFLLIIPLKGYHLFLSFCYAFSKCFCVRHIGIPGLWTSENLQEVEGLERTETQGWELSAVQWMQVGSQNFWRRQQELTSFNSFSKSWIRLWHCHYNYNVADECGVFEGWRLIVGDVGGKAECGEVLMFVYLFLGRRNEECYLF